MENPSPSLLSGRVSGRGQRTDGNGQVGQNWDSQCRRTERVLESSVTGRESGPRRTCPRTLTLSARVHLLFQGPDTRTGARRSEERDPKGTLGGPTPFPDPDPPTLRERRIVKESPRTGNRNRYGPTQFLSGADPLDSTSGAE